MIGAAFLFLSLSGAAQAQDFRFDMGATERCLGTTETMSEQLACAGKSAQSCMETNDDGYTTLGMDVCSYAEFEYWDARLNVAYRAAMDDAETLDEMEVPMKGALRDMQRAWMEFRDRRCDFERTKWGGGSGGGPAAVACWMHETARQTLVLEQGLSLN